MTGSASRRRGGACRGMALAVMALWAARAGAAGCRLGLAADLAVETASNRPIVTGTIDGRTIRILVATGSSDTFLQRDAAQRLGLRLKDLSELRVYGIGGERRAQQTTLGELRLGQFIARSMPIAVLPDPIAGADLVLGESFLAHYAVEFDLPHRALRLFTLDGCHADQVAYWAKAYSQATLVERPEATGRIRANVLLNGKAVEAELDSGAAVSIVSTGSAAMAGITHEQAEPGSELRLHGTGRGSVDSWVATFPSFALGDESIRNARLRVADLGANAQSVPIGSRIERTLDLMPTMLLGADFLMSHRLLVDGHSRWLVFTYEGGPVFQLVHPPDAPSPAPEATAAPAHH